MKSFIGALLVALAALGSVGLVRAEDKPGSEGTSADAKAVLDKAIKALGGEEKLSKVHAVTSKFKGKFIFGDNESEFTAQTTVQGLNHYRGEFEGEFAGNKVKGVTVLAGDKGWRKLGDATTEMDKEALANEKRTVYLQVLPALPVLLKGKDFKVETAKEEKVGDKPAAVLKVTPPDGKVFSIFFDKESGLPVQVTAKVASPLGDDFVQEVTYAEYKDFQGIKRATKQVNKRDGTKFFEADISDIKLLDKVDAKTFEEPK
jgi:hypothetical protein